MPAGLQWEREALMANDKSWAILRDDYESEESFRNACRQSMLDIEAIQFREGGAFIVAPLKEEVAPKLEGVREFEMVAVRYSHTFLPAVKRQGPEEEEGGNPEAEALGRIAEDENIHEIEWDDDQSPAAMHELDVEPEPAKAT